MSLSWRVATAAGVALLVAVLALIPGPLGSPIRRLANYDADSADPIYNRPLDARALRSAGALVPDDATYFVHSEDEHVLHDLQGAAYLFLTPALPVDDPVRADWILSYGAEPAPAAISRFEARRLSDRLYLVRVLGR